MPRLWCPRWPPTGRASRSWTRGARRRPPTGRSPQGRRWWARSPRGRGRASAPAGGQVRRVQVLVSARTFAPSNLRARGRAGSRRTPGEGMELGYAGLYVGRRKRRSAVLPALMSVAALAMGAYLFLLLRPTVTGTVVDAYSHQPLGGTTVALGDDRATTNGKGQFTLSSVKSASTLSVEAPLGYAPASQDVPAGRVRGLQVAVRPTTLSGTITRRGSGAPLAGIEVQAINDAGGSSTPATTGDDGAYSLDDVPEGARLVVVGPGFARKEIAIGQTTGLDLELRPDILTGVVRTRDGKPIKGATVGMAGLIATTK